MIPSEVSAIANLIFSDWRITDDLASKEVLAAAWRIYNAGYRTKHDLSAEREAIGNVIVPPAEPETAH